MAPIGYLSFFPDLILILYTASTTILAKKSLSEPINFEDIEVLQQFIKASCPNLLTLTAIFF